MITHGFGGQPASALEFSGCLQGRHAVQRPRNQSARVNRPRRAAQRESPRGPEGARISIGTDAETKKKIIAEYATTEGDTGSPEVQIALLSHRISHLTEHLKTHAKDFHSRRGLLVLVGQRRGLLDYLKRKSQKRYETLIGRLNLRR